MAFKRIIQPDARPDPSTLTAQMAGIGMNFAADPDRDANIEDTLIFASEVGMTENDLRVLSVLTTWLEVHHRFVNADRLVRAITEHPSERVRAYWSAVATWLSKDRRFSRLSGAYEGPSVDLLPTGTEFQLERRGEDERFEETVLRVPSGTLRRRDTDVHTPETLVRHHRGYRNRVLMGPSWRADIWTALESDPDLSVAEAARRAYSSFAAAWEASRDFHLLHT